MNQNRPTNISEATRKNTQMNFENATDAAYSEIGITTFKKS